MRGRRVRFARTDSVCVLDDTVMGPVRRSRPYHHRHHRANAVAPPPSRRRVHDKHVAARLAHEHAVRCEASPHAESVLLLLHKLRRSRPDLWNATGWSASAEDDMSKLDNCLRQDPPACGKLEIEMVELALLEK